MAGKTKINGTEYTIKGGKCKVNSTAYSIKQGKTKIEGTSKTIAFSTVPQGATALFHFSSDFVDSINGLTGSALSGSPTISGTNPFGEEGSLYLDSGNTSLTIPYSSNLNLTDNGTVEFWIKCTAVSNSEAVFFFGNPARSGGWTANGWGLFFRWNRTVNGVIFGYGNGSAEKTVIVDSSTSDVVNSTWHHWSINRSNGSGITVYFDGVLKYSGTISDIILGTNDYLIGRSRDLNVSWTGYMSELLVVQGRILRTADFTPPTEPYVA